MVSVEVPLTNDGVSLFNSANSISKGLDTQDRAQHLTITRSTGDQLIPGTTKKTQDRSTEQTLSRQNRAKRQQTWMKMAVDGRWWPVALSTSQSVSSYLVVRESVRAHTRAAHSVGAGDSTLPEEGSTPALKPPPCSKSSASLHPCLLRL